MQGGIFMSSRTRRHLTLANVRQQVVGINARVPIFGGKRIRYVNLDNAATTPILKPVLQQVEDFLPWYAGVHRSTGHKSLVSTTVYDEAREAIAEFFGAHPDHNIVIFGKNTTEVINLLARRLCLSQGDIILGTMMEHHSNDLPWRQVAKVMRINVDREGRLDLHDLEQKLTMHHRRIKLVTISGASNVTGWINDIHYIASLAHSYGIPIMVDGAQLAAHRAINLLDPKDPRHIDFLAVSGHKLYAPFGTGVLVGPRHLFEKGGPALVGGGTVKLVTLSQTSWTNPPFKEEAGSPNVVGVVALAAALKILDELDLGEIAHHEQSLTDYALQHLGKVRGLKVYGSTRPGDPNRLGVISFALLGYHHALVAAILAFHAGIGVRSGCFCAQPYLHYLLALDTKDMVRLQKELALGDTQHLPGLVRISFGMYNNTKELHRLVGALHEITSRPSNYWQDKLIWNEKLGCYMPKDQRLNPVPFSLHE